MVLENDSNFITFPIFIIFGFITLFTTFSLLEGLESNEEANKRKLKQYLQQQQQLQQQQSQPQLPPYFYYPRYINVNNQQFIEQIQQQQQYQEQSNSNSNSNNNSFVYSLFNSLKSIFSFSNTNSKTTTTTTTTSSSIGDKQQQSQPQQPVITSTSTTTTTTQTQITSIQQLNSKIVELEERLEEELHNRNIERKGRLAAEEGLQDEVNHLNILSKKHKELEQQHIGLWKLYTLSNKRKKALQFSMDDINGQLLTLMDQFQHSISEQCIDSLGSNNYGNNILNDSSDNSSSAIDYDDGADDDISGNYGGSIEKQPISISIDRDFIDKFERLVESINNLKSPESEDPLQNQEEQLFLQVTRHSSNHTAMFNDIVKFTDICR